MIYNPISGRNRHLRAELLDNVAKSLIGLGHSVRVDATTAPGSATIQAREAVRKGADIVFACGGDGTVNEVVQGLVSEAGAAQTALGIIPLGTENALARDLGLSLTPVKAALQEIEGTLKKIPVGKVTFGDQARYFIVMAGVGADGALVYRLAASQKSSLGRHAYYLRAAQLFATRRFQPFEVQYTEARSGAMLSRKAVSVMAARVSNLGGLFSALASRGVGIEQGHLRLLILRPPALVSLPLWFILGWFHLHSLNGMLESVDVSRFACRACTGSAAPHFQADGECLGRLPMEVSMITDGLRILVPRANSR